VDIHRLRLFAVPGNLYAHSASHPDLDLDTTPHANTNTDAVSNAGLRGIPVEARLV